MAAQLICNQWVAGSTPVTSSKNKRTGDKNKSPVRFLFWLKMVEKSLKECHERTKKRPFGFNRIWRFLWQESLWCETLQKVSKSVANQLTNCSAGGNIYRQSARRMCKTKYGRVPEWPMGTDCKSAAFSFGGSNPPAPTK